MTNLAIDSDGPSEFRDEFHWFRIGRYRTWSSNGYQIWHFQRYGVTWEKQQSGIELMFWCWPWMLYVRRRSNEVMASGHTQRWIVDWIRRDYEE